MAYEPATKENLERIAALGARFRSLFMGFAKIVEDVPPEFADLLQINGLNTIEDRITQAIDRATELDPKVRNLRKRIRKHEDAAAEAKANHAKGKKGSG